MSIEINTELVVSTAHVTESEANNSPLMDYSSDMDNTRLLVGYGIAQLLELPMTDREQYKNLLYWLKVAQSHNCKWLLLDADGDVLEGFPTFDW